MTGPREPICGSLYPAPEGDCVCLEPPHDPEIPHKCEAPGCGRQWFDKPARRSA